MSRRPEQMQLPTWYATIRWIRSQRPWYVKYCHLYFSEYYTKHQWTMLLTTICESWPQCCVYSDLAHSHWHVSSSAHTLHSNVVAFALLLHWSACWVPSSCHFCVWKCSGCGHKSWLIVTKLKVHPYMFSKRSVKICTHQNLHLYNSTS